MVVINTSRISPFLRYTKPLECLRYIGWVCVLILLILSRIRALKVWWVYKILLSVFPILINIIFRIINDIDQSAKFVLSEGVSEWRSMHLNVQLL